MKFNFTWSKEIASDEVLITANPSNKTKILEIQQHFDQENELLVLDPRNNRSKKIDLMEVVTFEAMGHVAKVSLDNQQHYIIQKRLKELTFLEKAGFHRINNSQILNLQQVESFGLGEHARLEVFTKTNQHYIVSRHYAKTIKERLSCANN